MSELKYQNRPILSQKRLKVTVLTVLTVLSRMLTVLTVFNSFVGNRLKTGRSEGGRAQNSREKLRKVEKSRELMTFREAKRRLLGSELSYYTCLGAGPPSFLVRGFVGADFGTQRTGSQIQPSSALIIPLTRRTAGRRTLARCPHEEKRCPKERL